MKKTVDRLLAVLYLLVGYGFIYVFSGPNFSALLAGFTVLYAAVVFLYLWGMEKKPEKESWFWLFILFAIALPYPFWTVLPFLQPLALMAAAAYWTLGATGRLLGSRTSEWIFLDMWNALAAVPFGNFACQAKMLFYSSEGEAHEEKNKMGIYVLLGIILVLPVLFIILPLLSSADAAFERLVGELVLYFREHFFVVFLRMVFAVPVSCYLYGLIYGGIHGSKTDRIDREKMQKTGEQVRVVPNTAICTALLILCAVYLFFIGIQGNYLFAAFSGNLPEEFTYSEYARRGFFELCKIGTWNLVILVCMGFLSKSKSQEHRGLRILTMFLSVLTILLIITAISKLGMYISVYGLTVNRILPMVFMIWMMMVFVLMIFRQKKTFSMVRICVMVGAVLFSFLCVLPIENWADAYNHWARLCGLIM